MELFIEQLRILVRRFSLLSASRCDECCCEQVSMAQCSILYEVRRSPDSSMQQIAAELGLDVTTFSRQVKNMVAQGLLARRVLPHDRRVNLLDLTQAGVAALSNIDNYMEKWITGTFEGMSSFEQETVARSLVLLNEAMTNQFWEAVRRER